MSSPVRPFRPEPTLAAPGRLASVADIWGRIRRVFLASRVLNNKGELGRRSGAMPETILRREDRGEWAVYLQKSAICRINRTTRGDTRSPIWIGLYTLNSR
jgi:hypothetical protein